MIERCTGSFVEMPAAVSAVESLVANEVRCFLFDVDVDRQRAQDMSRSPREVRNDVYFAPC